MIWTVMQVSLRRLLHNPMELLLTFVVPIVFFSIFALIFGSGVGTTPKIKVAVVDEIDSAASRRVVASLRDQAGLRFMHDLDPKTLARQEAKDLVRRGSLTLAIVLHKEPQQEIAVDLLADASDQVAAQVVTALVARCVMTAEVQSQTWPVSYVGDRVLRGLQRDRPVSLPSPQKDASPDTDQVWDSAVVDADPTQRIAVIDVIGEGVSNPVISMYAAGIAVMFLLFGATGGGGALLEERENQTLDRLLSSRMSMDQLLIGKWFYLTALGFIQVTVMFLWGQVVFGVDWLGHLDGFAMMTIVTAMAASAFGLFLATLCKTRGQLNGLSVILVLTMSALGGSMVPRYLMSDELQRVGLFTFNAWALDGYDKVFWRQLPVSSLGPQLTVLMCSGVVLLMAARMLATRWETD